MRVIQVEYRRTKQVARFEPEVISLTIELAEGESVSEAVTRARATARREFGETPAPEEIQEMRKVIEEAEEGGF